MMFADEEDLSAADAPNPLPEPETIKVLRSEELFAGERLVFIDHKGVIYRLQITARGRLILQK